jgi:thiol-disulfide isomerase/thioredoxin
LKNIGFSFLFTLVLISCEKPQNKNRVYFGGEILNPNSEYVILMQNENVMDSIKLNANNTFEKYYDSLQPGLYFFKHGNEFQYVFFEPKDSIRIRLNTWDFDESLVFDGIGSEKNDFLLSVFLMNEKEMDNFYSYFPLSEVEFNAKYEEAYSRNFNTLTQFLQMSPNISSGFKKLAEGAVTYPLYRFKELYPYYHQKLTQNDSILTVSPEFYNFRKDVNLNDTDLLAYYAYQNYISSYLYNDANTQNEFKGIDDNFKKILLNSIVEKIDNQEMKNRLLYQEIFNSLFKSKGDFSAENLDLFYKYCTDEKLVNSIKDIVILKENLPIDSKFKDFQIVGPNQNTQLLSQLIKGKPSVVYFWSSDLSDTDFIVKRVKYLSGNYPNIEFIGIYPDKNHLKASHPNLPNQFYLSNVSEGHNFISKDFLRTIIIDKNGKIVHNYTLLTDMHIEKQLEQISAKKK